MKTLEIDAPNVPHEEERKGDPLKVFAWLNVIVTVAAIAFAIGLKIYISITNDFGASWAFPLFMLIWLPVTAFTWLFAVGLAMHYRRNSIEIKKSILFMYHSPLILCLLTIALGKIMS